MKKFVILIALSFMLAGCTELADLTSGSSDLTNQDLDGVYHGTMLSMRVSMNADDTYTLSVLEMRGCYDSNSEAQQAIEDANMDSDEYDSDDEESQSTLVIIGDVCVAEEESLDEDEDIVYAAELGSSSGVPTISVELSEENGRFICDDGEEIPASYVNDEYDDCAGGEDEVAGAEDNIESSLEPAVNLYLSADGYGMMVFLGADEVFVCDDGEEIPANWVNDGENDCDDGEDEVSGAEDNIGAGGVMCMHLSPTSVYNTAVSALELLEDDSDFDGEDASTLPASVVSLFATHEANYALSPIPSIAEGCEDVSFAEGVLLQYIWANSLAEGNTDGDFMMYSFSVYDAAGTPTENNYDSLVYVAMDQGDDLSWSRVMVQLSVNGGSFVECTNPDQAVDTICAVSDNDDGMWYFGEEVTISEGSDDLCDGPCDVQVKILDRLDGVVLYESSYTYVE